MFTNLDDGTQYLLLNFILFLVQLAIFSVIPFVWYLITKKKNPDSFLKYIGLYKAPAKSYGSAVIITGMAYIVTISYFIILKLNGGMEISPLQEAYDISTPITFMLISILYGLNTGICEEILFRGFIAKRLIKTFNFRKGNIAQAIIFAFPHFATFGVEPTFEAIVGVLNAGVMGYAFGYIMHKKANGSILPSILLHALVNMIAIPISLFVL